MLFNSWKHHADTLRRQILRHAATGEKGLEQLRTQVLVLGHEVMDLYTGLLTPLEISDRILTQLNAEEHLEEEVYHKWLEENGGYHMLTLSDDTSCWVLRIGAEDGRYVHIHPGRGTPHTIRVRANVLKTAVFVNAVALVHGGDPVNVQVVNRVRQDYLNLSPIRKLTSGEGLQRVIELMRPHIV